jgi:hypothetical protein
MEIEENSILDDYQNDDLKKKEQVVTGHEDDYTNPEDISNENHNNEAITENSNIGFKKISSFNQDSSTHRLSLGIVLSKNHPVLNNI